MCINFNDLLNLLQLMSHYCITYDVILKCNDLCLENNYFIELCINREIIFRASMQHFSIKQCSSKLQGDFSDQQFSRVCSQKVSKWQQESNQFLVKSFNQEPQIRVQFTIFQ